MTGKPPPRRRPARLFLAGALLLLAGSAGYLSWISRAPVSDLMPGGAILVGELRGAGRTVARLEETRFARAFAGSRTAAWLESTGLVRAYDGLRAEVRATTGIGLTRRHLLDLLGKETVVAWYPAAAATPGAGLPWVAGCRLSLRAWCLLSALRVAERWGVGDLHPPREQIAGREVLSLPGDDPQRPYRAFTAGRLLVVGVDRELVARAARCAAGQEAPVTREPGWTAVRAQLPPGQGLFLWARPAGSPAALVAYGPAIPSHAGLLVTPGAETEIRVFAPGAASRSPQATVPGPAFPGGGLRSRSPLLLHTRRNAPPPLVAELLAARAQAVARRDGTAAVELPPLGDGFGLVVTDSVDNAPFPLPRGVVLVGMQSPAAAGETLRRLFPRTARSRDIVGSTAYTTRESLPLAGSFDLWAAAAGRFLLFASDAALLEEAARAAAGGGPSAGGVDPGALLGSGWQADAYTELTVGKAMPIARRYAPVLTGWLQARFGSAPDLGCDVELLRAIRSVTVATGTGADGSLARVRLSLADL
jgi:hypothetical protein